ncbi:ATP-binding cassette, subfamily C [Saccharopolyspora antimicrobica]|uniref:ATP-binding cassette subfamily C protein n=1 Tax=Saccharopolyspora antimicrobica TaxID=455193 RepID=A0A1I5JMI4_9PSEU|nr:ABC transporter ATP-binding protein [Saccharopolyspora antimicrobica]RKT84686.1 ATP-binding cassette subfamily C protein [Saccharopolyspora antimicrobica]SFO73955.1 ATP-binding cassette, subfamily C [Saccharopolyspora antimicrobica]
MKLPLADGRTARRWAWQTLRAHRGRLAAMMLLFGLATVVGLVGPQILGKIVDGVVAGTTTERIDLLAGAFLVVLVANALLLRAARMRATLLGEHLLAESREGVVGHALRLPLGTVESAGTGDLLSRATTDVDRLDFAIRNAAPEITTALITVLLTGTAMVLTSPLLACGMLIAVPLMVFSTRWYYPRSLPTLRRVMAGWADVQSSTHESVEGARTVAALRLGGRRIARNEQALDSAVTAEYRHRGLLTVWLPCLELSYVLPIGAILLIGGWAYWGGSVEIGTVITVVLYAQAMSNPFDELFRRLEELQTGYTALQRILGVNQVPTAAAERQELDGSRDLVVRDARFSYREDREVLHGIDLTVPAGQRLVVVGPSGAGKSTLGRLIAGISRPSSGSVAFGRTEIADLPPEQLRGEVVLLTQEQHIFACSLRDNLALPDQDFTDGQLTDALKAVGLQEWLRSLPDGLDTVLGAGGHPVPASRAQQLALARVLLADPHTVVLDEATSLLDNATSRELEQALATLLDGRTVIAIAHRLHSARNADRVAVMSDGRIVELGSHDELLTAGGSYAELYRVAQPS